MPSPREIAEQVNDKSMFADGETGFNAEEGIPTSALKGQRREPNYSVNPTNPPDPPAPCTGMHK